MKAEKRREILQAMVLSFLLSFGAVGSAVTGLELNVTDMGRIALLCACTAGLTALLSRVRFGGWLVSALILGTAALIWRIDTWQSQTMDMLCRITGYYRNAYGWPQVPSPLGGKGPVDWPVGCFALWIAAVNCWNLSRGLKNYTGILAASVPLAASVVVTDTVPGSVYLYLWLLGLLPVLLSAGSRGQNPRWGAYVVRLTLLPTAIALGILFWAVPREGYDRHPDKLQQEIVNWVQELPDLWKEVRKETTSVLDGGVQPETISLDTLGPRLKRVYPVMEVAAPVSGTVYLRGRSYDVYTGDGWSVTRNTADAWEMPEISRELGEITITTRRVRDVLYLPYYPEKGMTLSEGSVDNHAKHSTYAWNMRALSDHWRSILSSIAQNRSGSGPYYGANGGTAADRNLVLPEQTRRWAGECVNQILSNEKTATDVADAIGAYVRGSARYDLDTLRMPADQEDFARWFLEESGTGYCVHFATAATVLLRAAGVEARYVEGYMFSARMGEETTVTADQAHAWAEYYEPLLDAWIVLEATPPDLGQESETESQTRSSTPGETEQEETLPPILPPETTKPREDPDMPAQEQQLPEGTVNRTWLREVIVWLLAAVLTAVVLELQRRLRLRSRQRRFVRGSRRNQALERYRELERIFRLLRAPVPETATELAQKAKYSRSGPDPEDLDMLEGIRANALEVLRRGLWHHKLRDKYIFALY